MLVSGLTLLNKPTGVGTLCLPFCHKRMQVHVLLCLRQNTFVLLSLLPYEDRAGIPTSDVTAYRIFWYSKLREYMAWAVRLCSNSIDRENTFCGL